MHHPWGVAFLTKRGNFPLVMREISYGAGWMPGTEMMTTIVEVASLSKEGMSKERQW